MCWQEECEEGARTFAVEPSTIEQRRFADADFVTHNVGEDSIAKHHIRDAHSLAGASCVHLTKDAMLSDAEVDALVSEARTHMDGGVKV